MKDPQLEQDSQQPGDELWNEVHQLGFVAVLPNDNKVSRQLGQRPSVNSIADLPAEARLSFAAQQLDAAQRADNHAQATAVAAARKQSTLTSVFGLWKGKSQTAAVQSQSNKTPKPPR